MLTAENACLVVLNVQGSLAQLMHNKDSFAQKNLHPDRSRYYT
jgi:hypothetical protein